MVASRLSFPRLHGDYGRRSDVRTAEKGFATQSGVSKSAKVVLGRPNVLIWMTAPSGLRVVARYSVRQDREARSI
jgi:hypothetical protein